MSAPGAPKKRSGNLLLVGILLTIAVLLEQYFIARLLPEIGQLGGLRPMIVFLDIPLPLPNIDWIPVGLLFLFFYGMVISPDLANRGQAPGRLLRKKLWSALMGWWLLLICILAGGGLYAVVQDWLPRQVRNGIDSFGVRADITLPYPSGELVHLHGSMLLLLLTGLGIRLLLKHTALPPVVAPASKIVPAAPVKKAPAPAPAKAPTKATAKAPTTAPVKAPTKAPAKAPIRRAPASVHDQYLTPGPPADCRLTTPPPVAVIMPKPAPRIGSAQPCVAPGLIEPART